MKNPMMLLAFPAAVMVIGAIATAFDSERAQRQQWQQFSASAQVNAGIQADRLQAESQLAETRYTSGACVLSERFGNQDFSGSAGRVQMGCHAVASPLWRAVMGPSSY